MVEKDYTYLFDILVNGKSNTKVSDDKRNHIKMAITEMNNWYDLFIKRIEEEKDKKQFMRNMGDKPISNITDIQFEEDKFFKYDNEIKQLIVYHWFAYLLRYRLPRFPDGKTLRANRKKLLKELSDGKMTTTKTIEMLNSIYSQLKNI